MSDSLDQLESEAVEIIREAYSTAANPVLLYSIGKDSSVLLHLALKAFRPAKPTFPLLHIDTTWKFTAMYEHRKRAAEDSGMRLLVHTNQAGLDAKVTPFSAASDYYTEVMKTDALKESLDANQFDVIFAGARRDEERSRAKERIMSVRGPGHRWEPRNQRPELWNVYNTRLSPGDTLRVFPLSNWTEIDVWRYIQQEQIPVVPLYLSAPRLVVRRSDTWIMVDDERFQYRPGEKAELRNVRFRTLGCYPLSGAIESDAASVEDIIRETLAANTSEREGRLIDLDQPASMEKKKRVGYF